MRWQELALWLRYGRLRSVRAAMDRTAAVYYGTAWAAWVFALPFAADIQHNHRALSASERLLVRGGEGCEAVAGACVPGCNAATGSCDGGSCGLASQGDPCGEGYTKSYGADVCAAIKNANAGCTEASTDPDDMQDCQDFTTCWCQPDEDGNLTCETDETETDQVGQCLSAPAPPP